MRWQPSEFELYVNSLAFPSERFEPDSELPIRRLGAELMVSPDRDRDGARANSLVQDIRKSVEADTGRTCVVKIYE